jgi:hypothetical protein
MAIPGCGGECRVDNTVLRRFDVEEERGAGVEEAHTKEACGGGGHGGCGGGASAGRCVARK